MSITHRILACTLAAAFATSTGGCSSPAADDDGGTTYNCAADTRDEQFLAGMQKEGAGGVVVALTSATPAPPARDDNAWVIDVSKAGAAVTGATIKVTPFMPDHRHGTSVVVVVTPDATVPGRYQLSPINLWMPGFWEITIDVTPAGGVRDSVVFRFCITG